MSMHNTSPCTAAAEDRKKKKKKCSKRTPSIRKCKLANMYFEGGGGRNNVSAYQRAKKHSLTQQQALTLGLQCSGAAKQPRHQRDSMNALLQCVKWSWEAGRDVSVTEAEADESPARSSRKRRHMTQLITAHHPGRDRIHVAPSSFMYI